MKLELESNASVQNSFGSGDFSNQNNFDRSSSVNSSEKISEMLQRGISAAKNGDRAEARQLLLSVADNQPDNEMAWLWLASISEYPEELIVFLNNVLDINPHNERALEWAKATKSLLAKTFVQRGINAAGENQNEFANQCFNQALAHDAENEMAWLWLASISDSQDEKIECLQKVLMLNPENETARASLKSIKLQASQTLLKKANVAAISGQHDDAREMLEELMNLSPEMEEAWILKAYLASGHDEKIACFEKVLALNPENETARAGIDSLNAVKQRELERLAKKAETEKFDLPTRAAFIEASLKLADEEKTPSEESFAPEAENSFAAPNSESLTEQNEQFFAYDNNAKEEPFAAFEETKNDFYQTEAADLNQTVASANNTDGESKSHDDGPTQELDADFLQSAEIQAAFGTETNFAENEPQAEAKFETAEDFQQPQPFMPAAEESKDFEMMSASQEFMMADSDENFADIHETVADSERGVITEFSQPAFESFALENFQPTAFDDNNAAVAHESFEIVADSTTESYASPDENADVETDYVLPPIEMPQEFSAPETQENPAESLSQPQNDDFEQNVEAVDDPHSEYLAATESAKEDATYEIEVGEDDSVENYFQEASDENVAEAAETEPVRSADAADDEFFDGTETLVSQSKRFDDEQMPFSCPFCAFISEAESFACPACLAVLTLSDLEMLLSNQQQNREVIQASVERMENETKTRAFESDELARLGVGHLNLKNLRQGLNYLQKAARMNPNNVLLGSQVNALAIRLVEIEQQESQDAARRSRSCTILVVDDSPTVRKLISGKLEKCGHTVMLAVDGMDALTKLGEVTPDLILLDITMPRMDGYQVCKMIRSNGATKDVPVVMISGKDGFFDKVRGRMAGTTGYITKPFGPDTLMRTIETYLN